MDERTRVVSVVGATVALFLLVQLGALALAEPFEATHQTFEDPENPVNSLLVVGFMLVATAGMLVIIKRGAERLIRWLIIFVGGMLSWFVLDVLARLALAPFLAETTAATAGTALGALGALAVVAGLVFHPEWYVIDAAGVLMGAGAAGLFGVSFGIGPALLLLVVLAVYDAISVYGTEHMLTLAEGVMDQNIPVLFVIPATLSFSMDDLAEAESLEGSEEDGEAAESDEADEAMGGEEADETAEDPEADEPAEGDEADEPTREAERGPLERDALFIGLGDAVIPTILVASAGFFLDAPALVPGLALNAPALGAMVGTIAGLLGLMFLVMKGRPHAGLPLLNGGAITGYLVAALAMGIPFTTAIGL